MLDKALWTVSELISQTVGHPRNQAPTPAYPVQSDVHGSMYMYMCLCIFEFVHA